MTFLVTESSGGDETLLAALVEAHDGLWVPDSEWRTAAFDSAANAVAAALDAQLALARTTHPRPAPGLRIGIHTGEARPPAVGRSYASVARHLATRLCAAANCGQTLLSPSTTAIVDGMLPDKAWLSDLGVHRLPGQTRPKRIFQLRHVMLRDDLPPLRSLDLRVGNLPAQLTSFLGRTRELAAVRGLVVRDRLVTITGAGGSGKTRLAIRVAADLASSWRDGVWWVGLGSVSDPGRVAAHVASSLHVLVEPTGDPMPALKAQLGDRQLLLCVDNCEHLLDSCAELAGALLRSCPGVTILATSREPLGVPGETVWRVPAMRDDEAVALFGERATRVSPAFQVSEANVAAIRMICRRLDGMPLAVELAAGWVPTLPPARIASGLDDRFRLLSQGAQDAEARQSTLQASVQWSYDLLDPVDRSVFRQLAVFSGGFSIDAAREVCSVDVLGSIRRLVEKSLVDAEQADGEVRYRLLETVRCYALDQLELAGETSTARDRHLDHYLALAETLEPRLEQADQDLWRAHLEREHDNLRAALTWGMSSADPRRGRRLAAALAQFWLAHGHAPEGLGYVRRAIGLGNDDRSVLQARLHVGAAFLAATSGLYEVVVRSAERGLEIAQANDDDRTLGRSLAMLAYGQHFVDFDAARDLCAQARIHTEAAADAFATDLTMVIEATALMFGDRHDVAAPIFERAAQRTRSRNDRILTAFAITGLMEGALRTGDPARAQRLGSEAMHLAEPLGDYYALGITTSNLAWVKGLTGDIEGARRLLDQVVRSVEIASHAVDIPTLASTAGHIHLWDGDLGTAQTWLERAARFAEPFVENFTVARALTGLATVYRYLGDLDAAQEQADRAVAVARKLGIPHVLADALDEQGHLVATREPAEADDHYHEALRLRLDHGLRTFYADSIDVLAHHAAQIDAVQATRFYAAGTAARRHLGYPTPPVSRERRHTELAGLQAQLGPGAFADAWAEGRSLSLDEAVAYARRTRGQRGRPASGWASLTPTELDVVERAVEGLTNDQIGARLLMSRNTVKTHLSHIYAKLDVSNRTELAVLALSRGRRRG